MTTYSVSIQNNSGVDDRQYGWFSAQPILNSVVSSPEAFSNVWISQTVSNAGYKTVTWGADTYAYVGVSPSSVAPGVTISGGCSAVATLAVNGGFGSVYPMTLDSSFNPSISNDNASYTCSAPGSFTIDCPSNFSLSDNVVLGVGKVNPDSGLVLPVSTIIAAPNTSNVIQPVVKIYVNTSAVEVGQIVNIQTTCQTSGCADFTSPEAGGKTSAIITQGPDGLWTTSYYAGVQDLYANLNVTRGPTVSIPKSLLQDLKTLIDAVHASSMTPAIEDVGNPATFIGKIVWSNAASKVVIATGTSAVGLYLVKKDYTVNWTQTQNPDGTVISSASFVPPKSAFTANLAVGAVPSSVTADWNNALAGDGETQYQTNQGVTQAPSTAMALQKIVARSQLNGLLNGIAL